MDNMLYIIAGLALILLVAALFLRKNKAQKSSVPSPVNAIKDTSTSSSKVDHGTATHTNISNSHKFDNVTIAQRFMDQQRYDKAIETVKRGLSETPDDSALSLKLLSIYATINQPEDFNNVYESIKANSDENTIVRANEIKSLYFEEQNPVVAQSQELPVENTTNFESIDFDLPPSKVDTDVISGHSAIESTNDNVIDAPIESSAAPTETSFDTEENSFDLTLSDLENDFDAPNATTETPVTSLDDVDNDVLETSANDNINNDEDNDLSDFEFDFDSFDDTSNESTIDTNLSHNENEKAVLEEDDFILDFDDLAADADKDNVVTNDVSNNSEQHSVDTIQNGEDDFALSLGSLDTLDDIDTVSNDDLSTTENHSDFDNFTLENTDFGNTNFGSNASESTILEEDNFANINLEEPLLNDDIEVNDFSDVEESNIAPAAPLRFDDNTLIDDDFNIDDADSLFDAPSTTTPVSTAAPVESDTPITPQETESAEDFSSRFAADFDFVKSLDSNQVTLDLADQYLQLGEYDSAKRLLNEVIAQGTSEQKQQAQLLLERTA